MQLKDVLQQFLDGSGWKDEIQHDDSQNNDFISTRYEVDGQLYTLELTADQEDQVIRVFMVSPIKVPQSRRTEAAIVMNGLNNSIPFGNVGFQDDGTIYYRWAMIVEGATAAPQQFSYMVEFAARAFHEVGAVIGAAAFSKQSGEEILEDYCGAVEAGTG